MIDFQSATWHLIRKWAETELAKVRAKNDAVDLAQAETQALRGEIRAFKRLLDLPNQAARDMAANPD